MHTNFSNVDLLTKSAVLCLLCLSLLIIITVCIFQNPAFNQSLMIPKAVSACLAILATYCSLKLLLRHLRRRQYWAQIAKIQDKFETSRNQLHDQLAPNATKWIGISSLPFSQLWLKLQSGQLKAEQVLQAFQYKAVECSVETNCITGFRDDASEIAKNLDRTGDGKRGPLHGIPVSVKECFVIQGMEATGGLASFIGKCSEMRNAPIVEFLEWAGAVPFCKTNLPQGMLTIDSRNAIYGTTTNPFDETKGPGGSSSGEGALVALGGSVLGVGTDIGGSVRIPASWSGCVALKPTSQRFLSGGAGPSELYPRVMFLDFLATGFLARRVAPLVMAHRALYSADTFQQFRFGPMVPVPFDEATFTSTKPLRIAFYEFDNVMVACPAMTRAVAMAKQALSSLGHEVVEWTPYGAKEAYLLICEALAVDGSKATIEALDDDVEVAYANQPNMATLKWPYWLKVLVSSTMLSGFRAEVLRSFRPARQPDDFNDMFRRIRNFRRTFAEKFADGEFDAILCPAFTCPALPIDLTRDGVGGATYTCLFNLLNWPAGVLPITKVTQEDEDAMQFYPGDRDAYHHAIKVGTQTGTVGLPVAVQVAATPYREEMVLRLMGELEKAFPFEHAFC